MKKVCVSLLATLLSITAIMAQAPGPFYRQFSFNPYLFNPGYVAINNSLEASVSYRQQWTNFKDAPMTAGASFQMPTSARVSVGFNMFTDKSVLLSNSNFMATFGYIVPIAKNQSLRFGLSGGVGVNKLDLSAEEMNTNDPTIMRASGSNYYIDGNFGAVYTYESLKLGFALTDIFKSNAFNPESFNKFQMSNLRNRLFSASYRFNVGMMQDIAIEPYMLYRQTTDKKQDYLEAATLVYFKENVWTGLSYNTNNGMALMFGMNVKDKFRFSYSYEFPPFGQNMNAASSHELHLGIRLARKKTNAYSKAKQPVRHLANEKERMQQKAPKDAVVLEEAQPNGNSNPSRLLPEEDLHKQNLDTPIELNETKPAAKVAAAKEKEEVKKAPAPKPKESFTMAGNRHYVVVGVFKEMTGSMKFVKSIRSQGFNANVALNPKNNFYYVYIHSSYDLSDAKKIRNEYKLKNIFKEAWIFSMDKAK